MNNVSKTMCYILRHKPEEFGIKLDKYGYVNIALLASVLKISQSELVNIANNDPKNRYRIKNNKIKCNFGHSIPVELEINNEQSIPETLFHGTTIDNEASILKTGLQAFERNYVHLTNDLLVVKQVGMRYAKTEDKLVVVVVNAKEMLNDGYKIFATGTSTFLTKNVPVKYLQIKKYKNK